MNPLEVLLLLPEGSEGVGGLEVALRVLDDCLFNADARQSGSSSSHSPLAGTRRGACGYRELAVKLGMVGGDGPNLLVLKKDNKVAVDRAEALEDLHVGLPPHVPPSLPIAQARAIRQAGAQTFPKGKARVFGRGDGEEEA